MPIPKFDVRWLFPIVWALAGCGGSVPGRGDLGLTPTTAIDLAALGCDPAAAGSCGGDPALFCCASTHSCCHANAGIECCPALDGGAADGGCGGPSQLCCGSGTCQGAGLVCITTAIARPETCEPCGFPGQYCCDRQCNAGAVCIPANDGPALCSPCGQKGEPCCAAPAQCQSPYTCGADARGHLTCG